MASKLTHVPALDGVRGIALVSVLAWHYFYIPFHQWLKDTPAGDLALTPFSQAWSGVDGFFVLSGFLIARICLANRDAENYYKVFYLRRICRIFPLYFLLLGSYALAVMSPLAQQARFDWLLHPQLPLWTYAVFVQNVPMAQDYTFGAHWVGITWSLAVEEQFYLFLPMLIKRVRLKKLPWVILALFILGIALRQGVDDARWNVLLPFKLDTFMLGVGIAYAYHAGWMQSLGSHVLRFRIPLTLFSVLSVWLLFNARALSDLNVTCWAALYGCFIVAAMSFPEARLSRFLAQRWLRYCGLLSYGVYLFHELVIGLFFALLKGGAPIVDDWHYAWVPIVALGVTFVLCHAIFQLIEKPILAKGKKYRYQSTNPLCK